MSNTTLLDRVQAAEFLEISTRTLDRHIAKRRFSIVKKKGKIYINQTDLRNFKEAQQSPPPVEIVRKTSTPLSQEISPIQETKYKILYDHAMSAIEKKDSMLRQMHYQLGVLETEAKYSMPIMEAKTEQEEKVNKIEEEKKIILSKLQSTYKERRFFFLVSLTLFSLIIVGTMFGKEILQIF